MFNLKLERLGWALILFAGFLLPGAARSAPVAHASHARRVATPPDSYLEYKVYSVDQLIAQVQGNPKVRKRFARHFQIPEERVVSYMRANLVESYIPQTGQYTVYCVHANGTFYPVRQTFRRGTKVFALRNGQPVMKWVCGNPLSKFLPAVETRTIVKKVPVVKVSPSIETLTPTDTQDILVPTEVETPVFQPTVLIGPSAASSALFFGGGNSLLPFLPFAFLPIFFGHGGGSGGGGGGIVSPPVPEPGPVSYLIALSIPVVAILIRRCRLQTNADPR